MVPSHKFYNVQSNSYCLSSEVKQFKDRSQSWTHFQAKLQLFIFLLPQQETTVTKLESLYVPDKGKAHNKVGCGVEADRGRKLFVSEILQCVFCWDKVNFLHSSQCGVTFQICGGNSVDNSGMFSTLAQCSHSIKALLHPSPAWAGNAQGAGKGNSRDR